MKALYLAWQDPNSRTWFPVGKLTHEDGLYYFSYLQGALDAKEKASFEPIWSFPDFDHRYSSTKLFPLFANRLLKPSRPDYKDFIQWLNIPEQEDDPIAILARSGGRRKTDSFEVFPSPERGADNNFHIHFFVHGLRYFPQEVQQYVQILQPQTPLFITHDVQDKFDSRALILRTEDLHFLGYCPRYLTQDFFELICNAPQEVSVTVERVNLPPTPLQFRLLCNLTSAWKKDFHPFSRSAYQVISGYPLVV